MSKLRKLKEDREALFNENEELFTTCRNEAAEGEEERDFTPDEQKAFDQRNARIEELDRLIEEEEKKEDARKRIVESKFTQKRSKPSPEARLQKDFSILRAIKLHADGKPLDGAEAEVQKEAEAEAKRLGIAIQGIGLPSSMMKVESRDLESSTAATAANLIGTDIGGFTAALRPRLKTIALGATRMSGLSGNLNLPIGDALASATWEGENDAAAETTPSTGKLELRPNRLAAFTDISRQLMIQSSIDVEAWVRAELSDAIARAVDAAALNGNGGNIDGILGTANIGSVTVGGSGNNISYADIVELETEIAAENADVLDMAYLTTPGVKGFLKTLALSANNAGFVWQGNEMNGYRAEVSTQVPSNLGSGTDEHAIIFGNWKDLIIANWGMVDILVNPYTRAKEALVELVVNSYWDAQVKRPESFAAAKDIDVEPAVQGGSQT